MKAKQIIILTALSLSMCCSPVIVAAQTAASGLSAERIEKLAIPAGIPLQEAVALVQNQLPKSHKPINVLYNEGAESRPVPALSLRNVAGPDALMLIAAAANVHIEPIRGLVDEGIIGFRFSQRPEAVIRQAEEVQPAAVRVPTVNYFGGRQAPAEDYVEQADRYGAGGPGPFPGSSGRIGPSIGKGGAVLGYGGGGDGGAAPRPSVVRPQERMRVYPLAEIGTFVEFDDFERTVTELLKAADITGTDSKLAFHEKTGVLVVRGSDEVQSLVQELLGAVAENHRQSQATDAARELARMKIDFEALKRERARLERRVEEAEGLAHNYERELRSVRELVPDKQ